MSVGCSCCWTIEGRDGRASFAPYFSRPPTYSEAMSRDSSIKSIFHSRVGAFCGGPWQFVSMKLRRRPRLHWRFDLRQFWQMGAPSSHLRWRSRHVKHPVRTRFGLETTAAAASGKGTSPLPVGAVIEVVYPCRLPARAGARVEAGAGLDRLGMSVAESSCRAEWEAVGDLFRGGRRRSKSYLVKSRLLGGTVRTTAPAVKSIESNEMETEHKGDGELKSAT
jgi:hypothetical protein